MPAKKGTSSKKSTSKSTKRSGNNKQMISLGLFAVSIFLLAVTFIKGENVWLAMHNAIFGLFGAITFIFPIYMIALAVAYAMDKLKGKVALRFVQIGIFVWLVCGAIDVFLPRTPEIGFSPYLSLVFTNGATLQNGGWFGGLIGQPLNMAFGQVGAIITVFLVLFIFVMVVTGVTLLSIFTKIEETGKNVHETYKERAEERRARRREDYDIPLDEEIAEEIPKMNEKQRNLISAYKDTELPEQQEISVEEHSPSVDEVFEAIEEEEKLPEKPKKSSKKQEEEKAPWDDPDKTIAEVEAEMIEMEKEDYKFPPIDLLKGLTTKNAATEQAELESTAHRLVDTLKSFGVETRIVDISRGPTVTRYELQPSSGVKISKITNLADDIALNLATAGVRIEAPIPNKAAVGIEVPNKASNVVHIREMLESSSFTGSKSKLTIALGKDIGGNAIVGDIARMPHGLIAGATGSGKSVCINSIVMSILYKARPDEVKLIMVDPKVVELGVYNGIPHLLLPVVTDPRKAASTLGWAVSEMEKRYQMFAASGVRDLDGFNRIAESDPEMVKLPRIVIIVDELADLMMTAPKEVEDSINRIAAKARAAGMHLIIATQRPSVDVVTGVIKANIPSRIAFAVSSQIDSRTILDTAGAEKLLGRGDMLFSPVGSNKPARIQGCFVSDEEVEAVTDFIKGRHTAEYNSEIMEDIENRVAAGNKDKGAMASDDDGEKDAMLDAAIDFVVESRQASTSVLQRKLKLGYARAARIMDQMEEMGVVGPSQGAKPREVLMTPEMLMERKAGEE